MTGRRGSGRNTGGGRGSGYCGIKGLLRLYGACDRIPETIRRLIEVYNSRGVPGKENAVAIKTELAWVAGFKVKAAQPYTAAELARLQAWAETVDRVNARKHWPPGTLQGLLDKAHIEDNERYERR